MEATHEEKAKDVHVVLSLLLRDCRIHDGRDHAVHMIFVAQETVLPRHAAGVAGLAEIFFHRAEIGHEAARIALRIALQIGAPLLKVMTGEAATMFQDAEMRFVDKSRKASLHGGGLGRREIDEPPPALDRIDAMTFRA